MFSLLWSAIKPVVDPITKEKVVFSSTGSQLDKVLQQQHFGPELREWISAEARAGTFRVLGSETLNTRDGICVEKNLQCLVVIILSVVDNAPHAIRAAFV